MGIYLQILWNASQGRGLASTMLQENTNHLAEHVAPVLWLLAPIYGLFPHASLLFVVQQLCLAGSGLVVYITARALIGRAFPSLIVLLAYLAMPALARISLSEFHPVVMAALPTSIAAYGVVTGRWRLALGGAIVALLFEEESAMVLIGLGLTWIWLRRPRWRFGVGLSVLGVVWLLVATFVIMPAFQHRASRESGNRAAGHFEDLQEKPLETVVTYAQERTLDAATWLLLPYGGVNLMSPETLIAAGPATLVLFFQDRIGTYGGHWAAAMLPIYGVATAAGLARLGRRGTRLQNLGAAVVLVAAVSSYIVNSHFPGGRDFDAEKFVATSVERDMAEAVALVPPTARVVASRRIVPHVINRADVWQFPPNLYASQLRPDPARQDYYVLDLTDSPTRRTLEDLNGDTVLTRRPRYHVRQFGDFVLLLSRDVPAASVERGALIPSVLTYRGFDLEQEGGTFRMRSYWVPEARSQQDILRVLQLTDGSGMVLDEQVLSPLVSMLPPSRWERGQVVAEQATLEIPPTLTGGYAIRVGWRTPDNRPIPFEDGTELLEVFSANGT